MQMAFPAPRPSVINVGICYLQLSTDSRKFKMFTREEPVEEEEVCFVKVCATTGSFQLVMQVH